MLKKLKTPTCIFIVVLFVIFAALQYNDPDPYYWMPIYLAVSWVALMTIWRPINKFIILGLIVLYVAGAIYLWPEEYMGVTMPMSYNPAIEYARESLGLLIAASSYVWLYILSAAAKKAAVAY